MNKEELREKIAWYMPQSLLCKGCTETVCNGNPCIVQYRYSDQILTFIREYIEGIEPPELMEEKMQKELGFAFDRDRDIRLIKDHRERMRQTILDSLKGEG